MTLHRSLTMDQPAIQPDYRTCQATGKRGWVSRKQARQATRGAGHRMRVYWCDSCHAYHATKTYA